MFVLLQCNSYTLELFFFFFWPLPSSGAVKTSPILWFLLFTWLLQLLRGWAEPTLHTCPCPCIRTGSGTGLSQLLPPVPGSVLMEDCCSSAPEGHQLDFVTALLQDVLFLLFLQNPRVFLKPCSAGFSSPTNLTFLRAFLESLVYSTC